MFASIWRTRHNTPHSVGDSEFAFRFFLIVLTDAACWAPIIGLKILAFMKYPVAREYHWFSRINIIFFEILLDRKRSRWKTIFLSQNFEYLARFWLNFFFVFPVADLHAWVVVFILPVNSAINPLLYTFTTPKFRERLNEGWLRKIRNYLTRRSSVQGKRRVPIQNPKYYFFSFHLSMNTQFPFIPIPIFQPKLEKLPSIPINLLSIFLFYFVQKWEKFNLFFIRRFAIIEFFGN